MGFKEELSFEVRCAESARVRAKFPFQVAVIVQPGPGAEGLAVSVEAKKRKYLVPADMTLGQFVYTLRKRFTLPPEKAIFVFVDKVMPPTAELMGVLYARHSDEDGFMYIMYAAENTFG